MSPPRSPEDNGNSPESVSDLRNASSLIEALIREIKENSTALATFGAELKSVRQGVEFLSKIINDGDGKGSMLTRISLLENDFKDLQRETERTGQKVDRLDDTSRQMIVEDRKDAREQVTRKWQFWAAVVTAVLSLIGAGISIYFNVKG